MLKRLIKYGNSNALVLDRSILALLDIEEGDLLKLKIEGDKLIVKAEKNAKPTDQLKAAFEGATGLTEPSLIPLKDAIENNTQSFFNNAENDPDVMENLKEWVPGTENHQKLQEAYANIMQKYKNEIEPFYSKECQKELEDLNKKYKNNQNSREYCQEFCSLRLKFAPKLAQMDQEMRDAAKALGCPEYF